MPCCNILHYTSGGQTTSSIYCLSHADPRHNPQPPQCCPLSSSVASEQLFGCAPLWLPLPSPTRTLSTALSSWGAPLSAALRRSGVLGFTQGWQEPSPGQEVSLCLRLCLIPPSCRWELHCQQPTMSTLAKQRSAKPQGAQHCPGSGTGQGCLPGDLQDGHPGRGCPISIITETVGVFSLVLARHLCRHGPR